MEACLMDPSVNPLRNGRSGQLGAVEKGVRQMAKKPKPTYAEIEAFIHSLKSGLQSEKEWIEFGKNKCESRADWERYKLGKGFIPDGKKWKPAIDPITGTPNISTAYIPPETKE